MKPALTVIVPAHNPRQDHIQAALAGLQRQSLDRSTWALILVDNRSEPRLEGRLDLRWHPAAAVVREEQLGLTRARVAGFRRAESKVCVLVDDDNILAHDYLEQALRIAEDYPILGTWGGSVVPQFERPDLAPPQSLFPLLTLRVTRTDLWSNDAEHHGSTPWGAGLCVRREVAIQHMRELEERAPGLELDLHGERLLYGGDTDIAYTGCGMGLGKGVFKALEVEHLIPAARCSAEYLCRVAEGRGYSEVLHHLARTGKLPAVDRSFSAWLRAQRAVRVGARLERRVSRARLAGRARALRELGLRV
jgi:hypothetical protein